MYQKFHNQHCPVVFAVSANECECLNGTPVSGAMCLTHGDKTCAECNTGWKLNVNNTGCIRTFADGCLRFFLKLRLGLYACSVFCSNPLALLAIDLTLVRKHCMNQQHAFMEHGRIRIVYVMQNDTID